MPRIKVVTAVIFALSVGLTFYFLRDIVTAIEVFLSLSVGIVLGHIIFVKQREATTPSQARKLKDTVVATEESADALFKEMLNGVREGVLVVDEETRVVASNKSASRVFNRLGDMPEGTRLSSLTRNSAVHSAFRSALDRGLSTDVKVELLDEERRHFDIRVTPICLDQKTSRRGAIGVFFDITRLERLERVRQEFLSNVSHELRTPLTSILAFVETLDDGAIHDQQNSSRFLSVIRKNAGRMQILPTKVPTVM